MLKEFLTTITGLGLHDSQLGYYQWLLATGKTYLIEDLDPVKTSYATKIVKPKLKECFRNSILAAIALDMDYVEGYYLIHGIALEHAWNLDKTKLVDLTVGLSDKAMPKEYFGVKVPTTVVADYVETSQAKSLLLFYYHELTNKAFKAVNHD